MARKLLDARLSKVAAPPKDEPWVWHTRKLKCSPAWCLRSIHCIRLLEFLELEHLAHGGAENSNLIAPYSQLIDFGIGRRFIPATIQEMQQLGLAEVTHGYRKRVTKSHWNTFRLTYFAARTFDNFGNRYFTAPTNEWERINQEQAERIAAETKALKNGTRRYKGELTNGTNVNSTGSLS